MTWLPGWDERAAPSPAEVVDRAAALGARSITAIETSGNTPPLEFAVQAFAGVCDLAATAGVLVHIEPFAWSGIRDFGYAADIVAGAGRANGGLILDTWHLYRGPDHGVLPPNLDAGSVFGLQLNDIRAHTDRPLPDESMHDRLLPGTGAAAPQIRQMLTELRAHGCTAPPGVEVFSDELAGLPADDVARRAYDALVRLTS
jgi:sugar phosphate isomerase/epimerase